jgi:hypothetical protein
MSTKKSTITKGPSYTPDYTGANFVSGPKQMGELSDGLGGKAKRFSSPLRGSGKAAVGGASIKGYKKGGKVKKTGVAKVHKGERVLNKKQAQKFEKAKKQAFGIKKYGAN